MPQVWIRPPLSGPDFDKWAEATFCGGGGLSWTERLRGQELSCRCSDGLLLANRSQSKRLCDEGLSKWAGQISSLAPRR